MKDFLLLFRGGLDFTTASPEQVEAQMQRWGKWMEELAKTGKSSGGQRLTQNGVVMSGKKIQITDGPYVEGKEMVGGFIDLKAESLAEAVEIAKGCPIFEFDGITEVREIAVR